jgi:hypothetical protein
LRIFLTVFASLAALFGLAATTPVAATDVIKARIIPAKYFFITSSFFNAATLLTPFHCAALMCERRGRVG